MISAGDCEPHLFARAVWSYPSSVFAPYANPTLDEMARELDGIFERIAAQAVDG